MTQPTDQQLAERLFNAWQTTTCSALDGEHTLSWDELSHDWQAAWVTVARAVPCPAARPEVIIATTPEKPVPIGPRMTWHGDTVTAAQPAPGTWSDGVQAAADLLKRMADELVTERGETDPDTGAVQFKSASTREWHASLGELAEEIERLKP